MMAHDKNDNNRRQDDEEVVTSSGSYVANLGDDERGRRALRTDEEPEERVTSTGSYVVALDDSARGRRGVKKATDSEEKVTSTGSYVADINEDARGRRGASQRGRSARQRVTPDNVLPEYVINGKTYKGISLISASTGEAKIVLVEQGGKRFALKIYHAHIGHRPNRTVLDNVAKARGNGVLIDIYEVGVWNNPEAGGAECDYEIMQYCEGGALESGSLHGKPDELRDVTLRMVAAADYCSRIGILHRDIKPENFLWVDKEHTRLVLADFGLAILCPRGSSVPAEDHRTKIYTAPEFYFRVPGRQPRIDAASDFYSVGISMLVLWSGENVMLGLTESELIHNKHNEKLPYPADLPADLTQLLRGLTLARSDIRWNFGTVSRWAAGKLTSEDMLSTGVTELNIVFNSKLNQVAHSRAELARFMLKDMTLGKKYLYSGRLQKWFDSAGLNDLAVEVENVVEVLYPHNQDAGFWTVVYMLDPSAPVFLPDSDFSQPEEQWNKADGPEDLGQKIYDGLYCSPSSARLRIKLSVALENPDSPLMIYLKSTNYKSEVEEILENADNGSEGVNYSAIIDLIYTLAPQLPFVMGDKAADSVAVLLEELPEGDHYRTDFSSPGFVKWLVERDPVLAGKVASVIEEGGDSFDVRYALSPQIDYNYNSNPASEQRVFTPAEVAGQLNEELLNYIYDDEDKEFEDDGEIIDYSMTLDETLELDDRLPAYLRSKGKYDSLIDWIESCRELLSGDNEEKYGPYDEYYAAFKIIKGMGAKPVFRMSDKADAEPLRQLSDLKKYKKSEILDALKNRHLDAWIASFFQEDPSADLKPKFAYERLTVKFVDFIRSICPDWTPIVHYDSAVGDVDASVKKARRTTAGVKALKWIFGPVMALLFLIVFVVTVTKGIPDYNPILGHYWTITIIFGIIGTCAMYAGDDNPGCLANMGIGFAGGAVVTLILKFVLGAVSAYLTWIYAALVLVAAGLMFLYMKTELTPNYCDTQGVDVTNPGFQYRELEALHFAFKSYSPDYDCTVAELAGPFISANKGLVGKGVGWGIGGTLLAILLYFGLYFLSPAVGRENSIGYEAVNPGLKLSGPYSGTIGDTKVVLRLDSLTGFRVDSASLSISARGALPLNGSVVRKETDKFSATLLTAPSDSMSSWYGEYRLDFNMKDSVVSGVFIPGRPDKKGEIIPKDINLKPGEIALSVEKPSKKKNSTSKSKSKPKSVDKPSAEESYSVTYEVVESTPTRRQPQEQQEKKATKPLVTPSNSGNGGWH